jgi:hypothetical protein
MPDYEFAGTQRMLITHMLNQSRNFYQIESKVVKENLLKNLEAAKSLIEKRQNECGSPTAAELDYGQEEEYEYYEEVDDEEQKLMDDENKERNATFGAALQKIQPSNPQEKAMNIQLSQKHMNLTTNGSVNQMNQGNQPQAKAPQAKPVVPSNP